MIFVQFCMFVAYMLGGVFFSFSTLLDYCAHSIGFLITLLGLYFSQLKQNYTRIHSFSFVQ
jgi:hypothetical protein